MSTNTDGIVAAAEREIELMPKTAKGTVITAWKRRAQTLVKAIGRIDKLDKDVAKIKEELARRPF